MCVCVCVCVCVYHIFFIHSPVDGHLVCFYILAIVNNVAMNTRVNVSFRSVLSFFSDKYPGVELLGHMVVLFLVFENPPILFSTVSAPIHIPTNSEQESSLFSTSSPTFITCGLFDDSHSDRCEVISHCGSDVLFPHD